MPCSRRCRTKANLNNRIMKYVVQQGFSIDEFDSQAWVDIARYLGFDLKLKKQLEANYQDE
ncbi:MAG: hypothetical protein ONB31_14845 [candidate division KSB1 bacterium]|nr:hypothetical protein [candidate division KSB1 bacterium]